LACNGNWRRARQRARLASVNSGKRARYSRQDHKKKKKVTFGSDSIGKIRFIANSGIGPT
jgi:hypothetical protein